LENENRWRHQLVAHNLICFHKIVFVFFTFGVIMHIE
jgi:hypothetical protein